ncbi:MAG: hypothetical protein Solivirus2_23 [Solivirus sp.]|uniref:Uncharacterized protein n=1 Tax=Solivirus sp. TaxID=2487772 RepID=A0A3G5AFK1_9VIRU|nr:MAG: hypothetical protein Solivirus2_23 [Solivirus sp.]
MDGYKFEKNHLVIYSTKDVTIHADRLNIICQDFKIEFELDKLGYIVPMRDHITKFGARMLNQMFNPLEGEEVQLVMETRTSFVVQEGEPLYRIFIIQGIIREAMESFIMSDLKDEDTPRVKSERMKLSLPSKFLIWK